MTRWMLAIMLGAAGLWVMAAQAQTGATGDTSGEPGRGALSNTRYLTATGATVPRPALLPQAASASKGDRWSYEKDRRIERSICANC